MEIENVRITDVSLSMADHGCLTFDIFIEGHKSLRNGEV